MRVKFFGDSAGVIRVVWWGEEVEISVSLARAGRAADRLMKTAVVFAVLYFVVEILTAFFNGAILRAVR